MSEKRFKRVIDEEGGISILDTNGNHERYYAIEVLDDLNDLSEENKELRQQVKKLQSIVENTEEENSNLKAELIRWGIEPC